MIAIEDLTENRNIAKMLMLHGFTENLDFFSYLNFTSIYIKWLALFSLNKCCIDVLSIPLNFKCTLKCKYCSGSFPDLTKKNMPDRRLEDVLKDAQELFEKVDYIAQFDGGGGEVFLYSHLPEFIEAISKNYIDKIGEHLIVTNGTVMPSDKLCEVIKENNISLYVSYYKNVNGWLERYNHVKEKLNKFNIQPQEIHHHHWIDFQFQKKAIIMDEKELQMHYEKCGMKCGVFYEGTQYNCYPGMSMGMSYNLFNKDDGLVFKEADKKTILEFNQGFHKKGAPSYCKYCGGFNLNSKQVIPAEQFGE